jgi:hypothetical protein
MRRDSPERENIVPDPTRRTADHQVLIQLIEADVDIGFGLVDDAKAYRIAGRSEFLARALLDASEIVADIERRLQQIGDSESAPFLPLLAELRSEIAAVDREEP